MKYLIVNGDDLGLSPGINRGIIEAHRSGILTSASLMVDMPWAEQAAAEARGLPELSVGLHACLTSEAERFVVDPDDTDFCRAELCRQVRRFRDLMGGPPTHLDSHHNIHRDARLLPLFLDLAREHRLPLREHSPARYFSKFYGQWDGETHLEQVAVESLVRMLETEIPDQLTELSCHPGYVDRHLRACYGIEREAELHTLCDPAVRVALTERQMHLLSYRELGDLSAGPAV
jgi:predicted glycoside hydrolase/deacetylase ChbG (UPF0249 family)